MKEGFFMTNIVVTIQDLGKAYNAKNHLEYRKLIEESGISKQLKSLLIGDNYDVRLIKNLEYQEKFIESIKREIHWRDEEIEKSQFAYEKAQQKLKEAQDNYFYK